jgi:hypothetical protein
MLFCCSATSADENTYSNPTLGISVTKPADWVFATAQQQAENLKTAKFKDEEIQKMIQKYSTAPLVAMMKHPEPFDDVNPSFTVKVRSLTALPSSEPVAILNGILPTLEKSFDGVKVVETAKETKVAGHRAGYMKINYDLQVAGRGSFPTCSEMWVIPRDQILFIVGAGTRQDEKTGRRGEIQKVLASLKIE